MSATATRNTISRQWELLRSLPARPPGITAQELVNLLDAPCRRPAGFRLDEYIASGALQFTNPGAGMIELRAWVSEELARQLRETPLTEDMRLQADGDGHHLSATLQDSWQLRWWLLSQTGKIVVHEPQALCEALRSQLEAGLQMYRDGIAATTDMPAQASAS